MWRDGRGPVTQGVYLENVSKGLEGHGEQRAGRSELFVGRQEFPYRDVSCSSAHHLRLQAAS